MIYEPPDTDVVEDFETVRLNRTDDVATIWMNRPAKLNAMNPQLHRDMYEALQIVQTDRTSKVIVFRGAGKAFCAGNDLKEHFADNYDDDVARDKIRFEANRWTDRLLRTITKPTVAMVHGYCFGGAFTLLASCDIVFAADDAQFGMSEVNWGAAPAGMVTKSAHDLLGERQGLYLALTGEKFGGQRAVSLGLATKSFPEAELEAELGKLVAQLAKLDEFAVRATKEAFKQIGDMSHETAFWWLMAKSNELRWRQERAGKQNGLNAFLSGDYKPGETSYTSVTEVGDATTEGTEG
jgi:trans-feruloyl-CoA hydratase/vanillin synthase